MLRRSGECMGYGRPARRGEQVHCIRCTWPSPAKRERVPERSEGRTPSPQTAVAGRRNTSRLPIIVCTG
jgi:hypothetical protein